MMKKLGAVLAASTIMLGLGVGDASAASGYRYEQHDCWIGSTHYGARTIEFYQAHRYTVTQQSYQTSPAAKAHRVQWVTANDRDVELALGGSKGTKNDVPTSKTWWPGGVEFEEQKLIFTVWDGATGTFCRDEYPIVGRP